MSDRSGEPAVAVPEGIAAHLGFKTTKNKK